MGPADKAIWYIESHLAEPLTLATIADVAGVSRFHLTRAFAYAYGPTPMAYLRARRLSEAAKLLAAGATDILDIALQHGYNSHEAFTRAFGDQFSVTPAYVRSAQSTHMLPLLAAQRRKFPPMAQLTDPTFVTTQARHFVGLAAEYHQPGSPEIPGQWQRFTPHIGAIEGQMGNTTFGLCISSGNEGDPFLEYVAAVEVPDKPFDLPPSLKHYQIAAQTYAVFWHGAHISSIGTSWDAAFSNWLPNAPYFAAEAASFERYDERFNPETGAGGCEIWLPVQPKES